MGISIISCIRSREAVPLWLISITVVILDQLSKAVAVSSLRLHESIEVISGFFSITLVHNRGAAFGILSDMGQWRIIFFLVIAAIAVIAIILLYVRSRSRDIWLVCGCGLVLGGAAGNIIDRLRFGYVIDFLDFYIKGYHWPAFNLADSALCVGAFCLSIYILKQESGEKR